MATLATLFHYSSCEKATHMYLSLFIGAGGGLLYAFLAGSYYKALFLGGPQRGGFMRFLLSFFRIGIVFCLMAFFLWARVASPLPLVCGIVAGYLIGFLYGVCTQWM